MPRGLVYLVLEFGGGQLIINMHWSLRSDLPTKRSHETKQIRLKKVMSHDWFRFILFFILDYIGGVVLFFVTLAILGLVSQMSRQLVGDVFNSKRHYKK